MDLRPCLWPCPLSLLLRLWLKTYMKVPKCKDITIGTYAFLESTASLIAATNWWTPSQKHILSPTFWRTGRRRRRAPAASAATATTLCTNIDNDHPEPLVPQGLTDTDSGNNTLVLLSFSPRRPQRIVDDNSFINYFSNSWSTSSKAQERTGATWLGWPRAAAEGVHRIRLPVGFGFKEDLVQTNCIHTVGWARWKKCKD